MSTATFGHDRIEKYGRVFRFGDHVDGLGKKFSLTKEEFEAANPDIGEVPFGLNPFSLKHYIGEPSVFDGMLGGASEFKSTVQDLQSKLAFEPLLLKAVRKEGLRMSAVFGTESKRLIQIDFVKKPVIPDCVIFGEGDDAGTVSIPLSDEDMAVFGMGMMRVPPDESVPAVDAADGVGSPMSVLAQHIHDISASAYPSMCAAPAQFGMNEGPKKHMALIHKATLFHGAKCNGTARFGKENLTVSDETIPQVDQATIDRIAKLEKQLAANQSQLDLERNLRIKAQVVAFGQENKAVLTPAARPYFEAVFVALASDLASEDVVQFGDAKMSVLDIFKAGVASLQPHGTGVEQVIEQTEETAIEEPKAPPKGVRVFGVNDKKGDANKITPDGQPIPASRAALLTSYLGHAKDADKAPVFNSNGSGHASPR
jgi:hypothetical protein